MKVDKALLEKYELGRCTPEEIVAIEEWLVNDEWDDIPDTTVEAKIGGEIWQAIHNKPESKRPLKRPAFILQTKVRTFAGAAAILILFFYFFTLLTKDSFNEDHNVKATNTEKSPILVEKDFFDVLLSSNSEAIINLKKGCISLSGNVLFKPKRDFSLQDRDSSHVFSFKSGLVYILSKDIRTNKLLVFSESELNYLPPIMRRHYLQQFPTT